MADVGEVRGRFVRLFEFLAQRMSILDAMGRGLEEPCNLDRLGAESQSPRREAQARAGTGHKSRRHRAKATVVFSGPFGYPRRSL